MRRRAIGVFLALGLAAVGALLLVSYVRGAEQRALAGVEVTEVLVVAQPVSQGASAADLAGSVRTELVPRKVKVDDAVTSLDELEGLVASVALVPGEQVLRSRFVTPAELEVRPQVEVPDDLLQMTVSLSPERAVGGQVKPGDTVAVLASFTLPTTAEEEATEEEATEETASAASPEATTHLILHKVLVANVQVERLPQSPEQVPEDGSYVPDLAPTGNLLITLAIDAPSVERLVFTAEHGTVWLALEPEPAPEIGTRIQSGATIYQE